METFVARQPIFDRRREVYAYELLFRSGATQDSFPGGDGAAATKQVIANTIFSIGMDKVLSGKRAFLNFDRSLLVGDFSAFPKEDLVIEILEDVVADAEVLAACANLHERGFALALDDFVPGSSAESLIPFAKFIKVDMRTTSRADQEQLLRTSPSHGVAFLAEKVETHEEFEWARHAGYEYFQGHFFEKPEVLRGRSISSVKLTCLHLLKEVGAGDLDYKRIASLIKRDVGLSYKLLRYVNSALFGFPKKVESIDHGVVLLGSTGLRQWAAVAALPTLAFDKPAELVVQSLVRAQFCARLIRLAGTQEDNPAFLVGLFSHLDAMLDLPLEEAILQVGLSDDLGEILLQRTLSSSLLKKVYDLIHCYEAGSWEGVIQAAASMNVKPSEVSQAYAESTLWAAQALQTTTRRADTRNRRRIARSGTLRVQWEDGSAQPRWAQAALQNVSERGLQLKVADKIPVRSVLLCNDAKLKIRGSGIVRYCNPTRGGYVVGVEFNGGTGWRDPLESKPKAS